MEIRNDRVGEENYNNQGCLMKIIEYRKSNDITVEFQDEHKYKTNSRYDRFKSGNIKNIYAPFLKCSCNVCLGNTTSKIDKKNKKSYDVWNSMIQRCYLTTYQKRQPTYIGCSVCDEWLCFENFEKWFNENYYEIPNERVCLDKDILVKGNKIYSPSTCIFVPQNINTLFTKCNVNRGKYPIGVQLTKTKSKPYRAEMRGHYIGHFETTEEAFQAYKKVKEQHIKEIANEYKDKIPQKLYEALYAYKVEITD